jgi:hypothetical protein
MFEEPHGDPITDEALAARYARDREGAAGRAALDSERVSMRLER